MKPAKPIHLGRMTLVATCISVISSSVAILREALIAARLGANHEMDAFFYVFTFIVSLSYFTMDAIKKSLSPIYIHYEGDDKHKLVSSIINLYGLFYLVITFVTVAVAQLTTFSSITGFDSTGQQLVFRMIWILSPTILLIGLWGILKVLLEADGFFYSSSISDTFMAISAICSVLLAGGTLGGYSLAIGIVLGAMCQFVWVAYWFWRHGFKYHLYINLNHPAFRRLTTLFWPPLIAAILGYAIPLIDRAFASHLPEGTISALSYADKIYMSLFGIIIVPMNRVLLPYLAQNIKNTEIGKFKESVSKVLGLIIYILTPLSVLLVSLRLPLVKLFYQRGKFDSFAAVNTSDFFGWLILGLMPMGCAVTLETIFSALEDTKTGSFIGVGSKFGTKIFFNLIFISTFGAIGIAMASPLMYIISGGLLFYILWKRVKNFSARPLFKTIMSTAIASLLAFVPILYVTKQLRMMELIMVAIVLVGGAVLFLIFSKLFNIPELLFLYNFIHKLTRQIKTLAINWIT